MCRELIHLWGPISICGYGLMIFLGLILFAYLVNKDPQRSKLMTSDVFADVLVIGTFAGLIGGRLLFIISNCDSFVSWVDYVAVWDGGFSLLGAILGDLLLLPTYLWYKDVPVVPFFDLVAVYAPLIEAIARIGCFWSGCCYGLPCALPWAVVYHDGGSDAPCGIPLHPTQLYSAVLLFIVFLIMRFVVVKKLHKKGQLILTYLIFVSVVRFAVDFWRADREFILCGSWRLFSLHQYIALLLMIFSIISLFIISSKSVAKSHEPF